MKGVLADCVHAVRLYVRTPGESLIAVVVLVVGMAFVGAFVSLYVDLILKPHPGFEQSGRIATVGRNDGMQLFGIPYSIVERIAEEMASIDAAAVASVTNTLVGPEREETVTEMVSEQFFDGLRPRLARGRGFRPDEHAPGAEPVAVISYRYWQSQYGGDPDILGTTLEVSRNPVMLYMGPPGSPMFGAAPEQDRAQFRIVGVMAEALPGLAWSETALWVPLETAMPFFVGVSERLPEISAVAYVRRGSGASAEAVARELDARHADDELLGVLRGTRLDAIDGVVRDINVHRDAKRQLEMFLAGSVLLALVAAANVSLFLLARAPGRRRELGIRMTIGAPMKRLARQLATEAGLLVVVSAAFGLLVSAWLAAYLRSLSFLREAEWRDVTLLDWRVLSLSGVFVLVLTLLVSLAPILGIKRLGIAAASRQVSARASLAQRMAGTTQLAVAGALSGAGVAFGWFVGSLMFGHPGYETADRYAAQFQTNTSGFSSSAEVVIELARRREVIEAIRGVTAVAFGNPVPGEDQGIRFPARIPDPNDPANEIEVRTGSFDNRFVDVLGFELIHGRAFEDYDVGTAVVLVNRSFARSLWGREDVVGEYLPATDRGGWGGAEIIGVLEDLSFEHPSAAVEPFVFTTYTSLPRGTAVVDSSLTAVQLREALEDLATAGELELQIGNVRPLRALRNDWIAPDRARGFLTITTGVLVVVLAAFGFYGTQGYLVAAGRREYAIRAALGAGPLALGRLVLRRSLALGLPGLALGALLAFIAVAWLRGDYVSREISPASVTLAVVAGLVLLLLAAGVGPARQAKQTQPAPLLRQE